jgi:hypothetical protein
VQASKVLGISPKQYPAFHVKSGQHKYSISQESAHCYREGLMNWGIRMHHPEVDAATEWCPLTESDRLVGPLPAHRVLDSRESGRSSTRAYLFVCFAFLLFSLV